MYGQRVIMTNRALDFKKHCQILFGSYCQVFQRNNPTNTPKERTVAALCLGLSGNIQGSYKYFALATAKKITMAQATPVPMTEDIIQWVNKIEIAQKIPEVLEFTTSAGEIVEVGDEYEESYHKGSEEEDFFPTALP